MAVRFGKVNVEADEKDTPRCDSNRPKYVEAKVRDRICYAVKDILTTEFVNDGKPSNDCAIVHELYS